MSDPSANNQQERVLPVSLIVASRNRSQLLRETIQSILSGRKLPAQILIVDQSDVAQSGLEQLAIDGCELNYLWVQSVGLSRANNTGIAAARYDLLAFTHDDVLVEPDWLENLIGSLFSHGPRAVVTGRVMGRPEPGVKGFAPSTREDTVAQVYRGRINADVLYPMSMALYRSAVQEVGLFDERLGPGTAWPAAEDNDLGFRLLEAGYQIVYAPEAVLYHRAWRAGRDYYHLRWNYGAGQGAYYAKHMQLDDRYMLKRLIREIKDHVLSVSRALGHNRQKAFGDALYSLGLVIGATRWLIAERLIKGTINRIRRRPAYPAECGGTELCLRRSTTNPGKDGSE